jgi:hypothetical protein
MGNNPDTFARPLNLSVLALAQHQFQHPDESRRALEEASQLINSPPADDKKRHHDRQIAQILFREGEVLINGIGFLIRLSIDYFSGNETSSR